MEGGFPGFLSLGYKERTRRSDLKISTAGASARMSEIQANNLTEEIQDDRNGFFSRHSLTSASFKYHIQGERLWD